MRIKKTALVFIIVLLAGTACKNARRSSASNVDTLFADTVEAEAEPVDSAALFQAMESYRVTSEQQQPAAAPARSATASQNGSAYYMIVGCFSVPGNAENYAAKIRDMGYNATIIPGRDNLQMVSAQAYATLQEGVLDLEKFRREVSSQAWVYVRR